MERRAAVAALCEPTLLANRAHAENAFDILDRIMGSILDETNRSAEDFKALRKSLGYGWSVAVAAQPLVGKDRFERWVAVQDKDIRWIVNENLRKRRLLRMDGDWVGRQQARLAG